MDTKDRIRMIMEDQHMTQQVFADFLNQSPATLSSIFNGRTRPTLNIVDSIKLKIPDINIEWLLYGTGDMYLTHPESSETVTQGAPLSPQEPMINFQDPSSDVSHEPKNIPSGVYQQQGVRNTHPEIIREEIKIIDKQPRRVTEIRVYYDDQTYETFVPEVRGKK